MKFSRCLFICLILLSAVSIFAQSETEKGVELYRNGDFDGAISILEKVVKADEKDRQAWLYLGASFAKNEKKEDALESFLKADTIILTNQELIKFDDGLKIISKPRANYRTCLQFLH